MRVLVVGDVMVDVVAVAAGPLAHASDTPARVRWTEGGAAGNVAAWLRELGADVTLCARVGDDAPGRAVAAAWPGVTVDRDRPTGTCVCVVEPGGERTMLPDRGANDALRVDDLPDGPFDHVHVSGYALLGAGSRAAARAALTRAPSVSVDPASAAPLRDEPDFLSWLPSGRVLLPNRDEAAVLCGTRELEVAARALGAGGEVVITLGGGGALWCSGAAQQRVTAPQVEVVDTTGAGDAFAAGFLHARLSGTAPEAAMRAGCALASRVVARTGAHPR